MTLLSRNLLPQHGPFVEFADCPGPLHLRPGEWPDRPRYQEHIFFELAEDLMGIMCCLAHIHIPFDPYAFVQIHRPDRLMAFSWEFSLWAFHLAHCPLLPLERRFCFYEPAAHLAGNETPTVEDFKHDLVETSLFLAGRLNDMAREKRCFLIAGY